MSSVLHSIRLAARRLGIDLRRWPESEPLWRVTQLLRRHGVDLVLDVGANDGSYASTVRGHGYSGRMISFEPVSRPFQKLRARSAGDPLWDSVQYAVGDTTGRVTINVAGNAAASSSVLPMLDRHLQSAPTSAYVGTEEVPLHRLDEVVPATGASLEDRIFLKVDVQGYERAVLDGADRLLASGQIVGVQIELSFIPLYEGGMDWREGLDRASDLGMVLMSLDAGFTDQGGQMLQADAVFFRP